MKKLSDLTPYTNVLPYASEIFGVYQPMLGWRAKRTLNRFQRAFSNDVAKVTSSLYRRFRGEFALNVDRDAGAQIGMLAPAVPDTGRGRLFGSFVADAIASGLPPLDQYDDTIWDRLIEPVAVRRVLDEEVVPKITEWHRRAADPGRGGGRRRTPTDLHAVMADQLDVESTTAGFLLYLRDNRQFETLKALFYRRQLQMQKVTDLLRLAQFKNPLDYFDPFHDLDRVSLSPIGIVHLFRQYFFEFDTFLGPALSHVWLSPGATVELVEVHTRKTIVDRTIESARETVTKTETALTEEDEISDAVKEDNKSDIKFGMNASAEQSWVSGSASASASIDASETQAKSREVAHRHMRQQTEKLSTEIRTNYKSTFRTISETTDTSSKRYVLTNTTEELINYELRRKMRQVGTQVQDIGTYLCWQTYVDDPGRQLGLSRLVHIAKSPEIADPPPPESVPAPQLVVTELAIPIPFKAVSADALLDDDDGYKHGEEAVTDFNEGSVERIQADFGPYFMVCDRPDYHLGDDPQFSYESMGADVELSVRNVEAIGPGNVRFDVHLDYVHFHGMSPLNVTVKATWFPTAAASTKAAEENEKKVAQFTAESKLAYEKAFVDAARERIKLMSEIEPRRFEDLREEERIVVYRSLIQDMLTRDIPTPDDRTRHVIAELLNTIFDIDKMLYFVAPEWWRPRLHQSHQALGGIRVPKDGPAVAAAKPASVYAELKDTAVAGVITGQLKSASGKPIAAMDTASWGGTGENRDDSYYITEESTPARMGASLGWLLQLDGDNLRNAFLNAPWVKAVIPIRPGKERAAINWLQRVHVEGTDGLDDRYVAPPEQLADIPHAGEFVTIRDAINHLCDVVAAKHKAGTEVGRYPTGEIHDDNKVSATPIDKVYEHGFYPLQGGFRTTPGADFEVFDQWVEVLPTDQIVPVEVTYDPKTGRQI